MKTVFDSRQTLADGTVEVRYTLAGTRYEWQAYVNRLFANGFTLNERANIISKWTSPNTHKVVRPNHGHKRTTVQITITDESVPYAEWWSGC